MTQYPSGAKPAQGKVTAAFILGIVGLFILPIILCPIGAYLGFSAAKEGNPTGRTAAIVCIVCGIVGLIGGALYLTSR